MARHPENPSAGSRIAVAVAAEYSAEQDFSALDAVAAALAVAAWLVVAGPIRRSALFLDS